MKIILITNIISPTRTSLFNALFLYFQKQGIEFKVFFNSATEGNRFWDYNTELKKTLFEYRILDVKTFHNAGNNDNFYFHINLGLGKILDIEKPNIIIHSGWVGISAWTSLFWCNKNNSKYILWSESTKYEKSWRRLVTKPIVKYLVKNSNGYFSPGKRAKEYLISLGAKKDKIQFLYNTVDVNYFLDQSKELKSKKNELKQKYGIKTKYVLLFVGQFIKRKGIYNILEGFSNFQKNHFDISLVFVGGGEEGENMKHIIKEKNIKNVFFPGFFQIDKISELYTISDVFTLPSIEEVWGLVINEAMCFGLPIITSYQVGASVDLVQDGNNGYIMKENTGKEFESGLNFIFKQGLVKNNNSLEIIENFKIEKIIEKIDFNL